MSIISQRDALQKAYADAVAAAEALPHEPPEYRQPIQAVRPDLTGVPTTTIVGAIGYSAATKKVSLETTNASGGTTGTLTLELDSLEAFAEALLSLSEEPEQGQGG
jgi:hypothetical protein